MLVAGKFSEDERAHESISRGTEAAEILDNLGVDAETLGASLLFPFVNGRALDPRAVDQSVGVDVARLTVYAAGAFVLWREGRAEPFPAGHGPLVAAGCVSAFVGSYAGARLVKKVTLDWLQAFVAAALALFGIAMAAGLL